MSDFEKEHDDVELLDEEDQDVAPPPRYAVVLLNDDFTPMDFVVAILVKLFEKSAEEAATIMLDVHERGKGLAGTYAHDIAETKAAQVRGIAQANGHPLMAEIEPLH